MLIVFCTVRNKYCGLQKLCMYVSTVYLCFQGQEYSFFSVSLGTVCDTGLHKTWITLFGRNLGCSKSETEESNHG